MKTRAVIKKQIIFTKGQLRELEWFCNNCTGTRQMYYNLQEQFLSFKETLDRLEEFSKMVKGFIDEN